MISVKLFVKKLYDIIGHCFLSDGKIIPLRGGFCLPPIERFLKKSVFFNISQPFSLCGLLIDTTMGVSAHFMADSAILHISYRIFNNI